MAEYGRAGQIRAEQGRAQSRVEHSTAQQSILGAPLG